MKRHQFLYAISFLILTAVLNYACQEKTITHSHYTTWKAYLGDPGRSHYSTLSEITRDNLDKLKQVWTYKAPDSGQMQMNPLVVDSILYGVTAALRVVALNAETGEEIWRFGDTLREWHSTSRGVAYWEKGRDKRILYTIGPDLYALNALTGEKINSFGEDGKIDLRSGLPESAADIFIVSNTPGTIYKDLIVMPTRVSENAGAAPGDIMAFNVLDGTLAWSFKTIPEAGQVGNDTWGDKNVRKSGITGAANSWAGMALDVEAETLFVPTGSAAPDFLGTCRKGSNLYANCLLALDANTGALKWHFQFTHHDLWDRDPPAPPNLLTVTRDGEKIKAVAQATKQGYVFVFNRDTGEPLFEIDEVPVPQSTLDGEKAWSTQPIPKKPKPFARLARDIEEVSPYAENKEELLTILTEADKREYAPPSLSPVLLLPGYDGAAEWGGAAADPEEGILYVNSNEMAWILSMKEKEEISATSPLGERTYRTYCAACHQTDLSGIPESGFPSLTNITATLANEEILEIVINGKGMMTGFPQLTKSEKEALLSFLAREENIHSVTGEVAPENNYKPKYEHTGYHKFLDSKGLPAITPPWGTLHAIDLNTGDYRWSVTLGDTPELRAKGHPPTGCESYGGPIVTENGLLFIAGTKDGFFRIFDKYTGELLWEYKLPAASFATPAMYELNGKQYIALACGGEKLGTQAGNQIIAFALE